MFDPRLMLERVVFMLDEIIRSDSEDSRILALQLREEVQRALTEASRNEAVGKRLFI